MLPGHAYRSETVGHRPTCRCGAPSRPALVLDPFAGVGTTGLAADRLGRDAVLIEISAKYGALCEQRLKGDAPLFVGLAPPAPERLETNGWHQLEFAL